MFPPMELLEENEKVEKQRLEKILFSALDDMRDLGEGGVEVDHPDFVKADETATTVRAQIGLFGKSLLSQGDELSASPQVVCSGSA